MDKAVANLAFAALGTGLAGACFPLAAYLSLAVSSQWPIRSPSEFFALPLVAMLACIICGVAAFSVAVPGTIVAGLVMVIAGFQSVGVWYASLVGGYTGLLCVARTTAVTSEPWYAILAIVLGQAGAAGGVLHFRRNQPAPNPQPTMPQIKLRQLFGVTTASGVLIGILSLLRLPTAAYGWMVAAGLIQAATIGMAWSAYALLIRTSR